MTNAIKALLQMTSVSLQPVPSLHQKFPDGIVVCTTAVNMTLNKCIS
jgi:hypothetical protein